MEGGFDHTDTIGIMVSDANGTHFIKTLEPKVGKMFNEHQQAHIDFIRSLPLDRRCYCGWNEKGFCFAGSLCDPDKTRADFVVELEEGRTRTCPNCWAVPGALCVNAVGNMTWGNHQERQSPQPPLKEPKWHRQSDPLGNDLPI